MLIRLQLLIKGTTMRFAKFICLICFAGLFVSAIGCAATNQTMQSVAQKLHLSKAAPGGQVAKDTKEDPRVVSLLDDAIASWSDGDMDETQKLLSQAIKRDPRNREARHLMANLLASRQDYEAAQVQLRTALKADPEDARTHHALAILLEHAGNHEEAAKHLKRAQELDPALEETVVAESPTVAPVQYTNASGDAAEASPPLQGENRAAFHLGD